MFLNQHKDIFNIKILTPQGLGSQRSAARERNINVKNVMNDGRSLPFVNGLQLINGSPVISRGQLHTGVKPRKLQSAPTPHAPSQVFLQTP